MTRWMLQTAKNKFSELIDCAQKKGPQVVTRRGSDAAVILSVEDFQLLTRASDCDLVDFFRQSPLKEIPVDLLDRARDTGREVSL